jgi:hypothetical protein
VRETILRKLLGIGLLAWLLAGPAQAQNWPAGVRETFSKSCENSAGQALGQERAQLYCDCTVTHIDRDFSAADIAALERAELPPPLVERLQQVSRQCLESQGAQR